MVARFVAGGGPRAGWPLAVAVAVLPALITVALLRALFGAGVLDFKPHSGDEAHYWHETLTFVTHGFDGGYYVLDERPAPAAFTPFGPHGPGFPVAYGCVGVIIGWRWWSGVIINLALVTGAILTVVRATHLDNARVLLLGAYVSVSAPIILMLPTQMQESLHHAIAMVLAAMIARRLDAAPRSGLSSLFLVVGVAALLRATWALLLVPLAVLAVRDRSTRARAGALLGGTALAGLFFALLHYWSAPPEPRSGQELSAIVSGALVGHPVELAQRLLVLVLLLAVGLELARRRDSEPWLQLACLGPVTLAYFLTDQVKAWRDFRGLAPFLILATLLMIARRRRLWFVGLEIALGLAVLPSLLTAYAEFRRPEFVFDRARVETARSHMSRLLKYGHDRNRWCNTLSVSSAEFEPDGFVAVPAGIGISYLAFRNLDRLPFPLKSRYLLLDADSHERLRQRLHVRMLGVTTLGTLYLNLDASCGLPLPQ